ncbi:alpha/beta-hydrolase [Ramicandelaber brevisporus]|nr:alpha/beta-hydrolase [Ramicandelaber brevisporus]
MTLAQSLAYVLIGYAAVVLAFLHIPWLQKVIIFLHTFEFIEFRDLKQPEQFGLERARSRSLRLTTADDISLGAWHLLPSNCPLGQQHDGYSSGGSVGSVGSVDRDDSAAVITSTITSNCSDVSGNSNGNNNSSNTRSNTSNNSSSKDRLFEDALRRADVAVLYLHGQFGNRGKSSRLNMYHAIQKHLPSAHILVLDYRGFADSDGSPYEDGLILDALAGWKYLRQFLPAHRIIVQGHSLGSGVAVKMTRTLNDVELFEKIINSSGAQENSKNAIRSFISEQPAAVVLEAPYAAISDLICTFRRFPLLLPLTLLPPLEQYARARLIHRFESRIHISRVTAPVLIVHGKKDGVIPITHSEVLFTTAAAAAGASQSATLLSGLNSSLSKLSNLSVNNNHSGEHHQQRSRPRSSKSRSGTRTPPPQLSRTQSTPILSAASSYSGGANTPRLSGLPTETVSFADEGILLKRGKVWFMSLQHATHDDCPRFWLMGHLIHEFYEAHIGTRTPS